MRLRGTNRAVTFESRYSEHVCTVPGGFRFHPCLLKYFNAVSMELNDANLQTLTEFLRKTLDPDPTVRRPGRTKLQLGYDKVVFGEGQSL
ncbi:hypothetical protein CHARACLAT_008569 [Characodon lateralis]|uniref:Uncharacterized protein n=1 Tax=Characodon lateralis TaxID=208331 RepID=A0ABU7DIL5_9TELE|nr:hypothetical protein [Characodon lateralis]